MANQVKLLQKLILTIRNLWIKLSEYIIIEILCMKMLYMTRV